MTATKLYRTSEERDDTLKAIADAVLLINACMCGGDGYFREAEHILEWNTPWDLLRRVQSNLFNLPFNRFYITKDVGGGNGSPLPGRR